MAGRALTAGFLAALAEGTIRPAIFFEGEFVASGSPSETPSFLRFWTGIGDLDWDGKTWTGTGSLLGLSPIDETRDLQARGFTVSLSGMPSDLISLALGNVRQGKPGTLWLGLFDAAGALIEDPYQLQRGLFDVSVIEDSGDTCTIAARYESRLIDLEKPRVRYYTTEDQRLDYPDDLGFEYVPSLQDAEILWG